MSEIRYEVVTEAPVETIVGLYRAGGWWDESADPSAGEHARSVIPAMIRGSFCFMLAKLDDQVVGMGRAISDGASDAYIQDVVVRPEVRGRGIGGELVKRLAQHCVDRKIAWIGLVAEPGTTDFYEGLGFQPLEGYQPLLHKKSA